MDYQWYPGHMTRARRMMQEDIRLIDLVIELLDARIPLSSRNPDIDALAANKSRLILMNKCDLADPAVNQKWQQYFEKKDLLVCQVNSRNGGGIRQIRPMIEKACAEKIARDRRRGILNRPVRAMVCGIPNVGKSTFINTFAGKAAAKTGNKPGVTRGKQWIRLDKTVELLDTPGILWPRFDDQATGMRLALIGSIRDELLMPQELVMPLIAYLQEVYPDVLPERFGAGRNEDPAGILDKIASARGCLLKEGEPDLDRAAAALIDDFRKAKLGKISLEFPEMYD